MVDEQTDHLPVVDTNGRLRGMVTTETVLDLQQLLEHLGDPPLR